MAEEPPSSSSASAPEDLSVNISIVSPSLSVNAPLNFPGLSPSTTIDQLKQKVRDALDSKPTNEQQRLIHQGKLLARETETLLDVFGEQKIRGSDQVVLHLVIRDPVDHHTSSGQTPAPQGQRPAHPFNDPRIPDLNTFPGLPHNHQHHANQGHQPRAVRPMPPAPPAGWATPGHAPSPFPGPGAGLPAQPGTQTPAQLLAHQHQLLNQYMAQMNLRPMANPPQQPPAAMRPGVGGQDQAGNAHFPPGNVGWGRNSPHPHPQPHSGHQPQPYVQQGIGPNGEFYRVTMNSAYVGPNGQVQVHSYQVPTLQQAQAQAHAQAHAQANVTLNAGDPLTTNNVQNIMRTADASQATSIMTNAMHRSASGASLANLNLNNQRQAVQTPGVTVPRRPGSTVPLSRTATPDQMRTPSHGSISTPTNTTTVRSASSNHQPEVYILNSPQGPRALLINNPSDLYYTPAARTPEIPMRAAMGPPFPPGFNHTWALPPLHRGFGGDTAQVAPQPQGAPAPVQQQAPQQGNIRVNLFQGQAAQQPAQQQQQQNLGHVVDRMQAPGFARHPGNPEGGLAGALLAALWPHVWLLIRLAVFVWWFASANTSWTRWCLIMFTATVIFLVNTGLFNQMANNWFNPVRQHLEGLIPLGLGGPEQNRNRNNGAANAPQGNQNNPNPNANEPDPPAGRQQQQPDPAQAAARLVEQHRERNANWVMDQIRRLERAGLLFLASIAPGVAERHIAHLEAEARAERERQETAERERQEAVERAEVERREEAARREEEGEAIRATTSTGQDLASVHQNDAASPSGTGAAANEQQPVVAT